MSLHKTLKSGDQLARHRNVLSRTERIAKLEEERRWTEDESVFSLPKVRSMKLAGRKKKKKKEAEEAEEAGGVSTPEAESTPS